MTEPFFTEVTEPIPFVGPASREALGFRHYEPDRVVAGRRMEDHLRVAVCYWHTFCWPGDDVFGAGTFDRPWLDAADAMEGARRKAEVAFELFEKLGNPFFCFHDRDVAPEGDSWKETTANLDAIADDLAAHMDRTGTKLLWGTANLFSHPRYAAGAATNPDPDVFACAAAQVRQCLEVTHRLGGENYVLWGGREGYETLLNTDLRREDDQYARFLHLVVDHADRIGFPGQVLIEPKPAEPTAHQYDHDVAAVHGFLDRHDLLGRVKVNIEVNHATLAGHSFHHEVAYAVAHGLLGSVDANRGDPQLGWDTDQFPNSTEEMTLALVEILRAGGMGRGGFNFDTKLRRQSTSRTDLIHAHIGGMDTLARALVAAAEIVDDGELDRRRHNRYAGWEGDLGQRIEQGDVDLAELADVAVDGDLQPRPRSGEQEHLENVVNRHVHRH